MPLTRMGPLQEGELNAKGLQFTSRPLPAMRSDGPIWQIGHIKTTSP